MNWRKLGYFGLFLLCALALHFLNQNANDEPSKDSKNNTTESSNTLEKNTKKTETNKPSAKSNPAAKFGVKTFPWKSVSSKGHFTSPQGLVYGPGKEHRLEHVLRHAKDKPNRNGKHGVFDGGPDKTLQTIDLAFEKAKKKSKDVFVKKEGSRTVYEVNMGRRIGFVGGKDGNRRGKPATFKVRIVAAGNNVITAYPF